MNSQMVLTMGQEALLMLLMVSAPVLGVALVVGLLVSLFQAVTQIHEATLAFVPKLIAVIAVFAIAGPWMLTMLVEYIRRTIETIPALSSNRSAAARHGYLYRATHGLLSPVLWFLPNWPCFVSPVFSSRAFPSARIAGLP